MKTWGNKHKTSWREALSWGRFTRSFRHALGGVRWLFKFEPNARIHLIFALLVVIAGFLFEVTKYEWVALLLCIGLVISIEALNSALERLSDKVTTEFSEYIRDAKNLSAGAVLIASFIAAIIGIIIFLPYLLNL